ncbi:MULTISPECIES: hypothetical protein [unclassified Burkholderia]|uniref:hypothetical protein n=1 Tax=unclassified Burkholderia TaxID=2613784 RepID=UPI001423541C|nr:MULTISPECIES: hypothetical protein [unclassified Burkholderia]NIE83765.1 hypothetical protein [Burkholderia sp. Tr-860]NIF62427.1 hypothetical protein [Burkholderia sp. Cy-647]NIF94325.1 hypothetical protein [Burkholderia sp. Ax-1720]
METTLPDQDLAMLADPKLRMKVRKRRKTKERLTRDPAERHGVDFFVTHLDSKQPLLVEGKRAIAEISNAVKIATCAGDTFPRAVADDLLQGVQVTLQLKHADIATCAVFSQRVMVRTLDIRDTFKVVLEHYRRVMVAKGVVGSEWVAPGLSNRFVHQIENEAYTGAIVELLGGCDVVPAVAQGSADTSSSVVNLKKFRETRLPPAVGYEDPDDLTPTQLACIRAAVAADVADIDLLDIEPF